MDLERIGHELVVKGAAQFNRTMRRAQKATEDFQKTLAKGAMSSVDLVPKGTAARLEKLRGMIGEAQKATEKLRQAVETADLDLVPEGATARFETLSSFVQGFARELGYLPGPIGTVSQGLTQLTELVSLSTVKWVALTAVLVAAAAATTAVMLQLGARGARMEGVITAFDALTASVGLTSQALLGQLREASAGTVRDFNLMRQANLALTGTQGEFRVAFAEKLPRLLEIARAQARATGESFDQLFDAMVRGVKESSSQLIEYTGLMVDSTAANQKLADQVGVTVDQFTAEQKRLALLNETLETGQAALDLYGSKTKTAAEYAAGFGVRIQNMLDRLGVAILPLYTLLLQVGDALLETLIWPIENLLIPALYALNQAIFGPLSQAFVQFKSLMTTALAPLVTWLQAWLPPIIASFRLLGQVLAWLLAQAGKVLAGIAKRVRKFLEIFLGSLDPQKFFEGGARTIGALARGMLWAANNLVLPAVLAIATLIADFLVGLSPPKKGPLSAIDKGGENVMLAWLDGLTGVGLEPVEAVAEQVNQALGDIGSFSAEQIEARLLVLDDALQPFIDSLEIAKARFEAIVTPLEQILGMVDRRLDKALAGFFKGEISEEVVRALDQQREALQARIDATQGMTDQAATQLALAQSQQAVERALLEIQRRRLTATEEEDVVLKQAAEKLKKSLGSGDSLAEILGGGLGDLGGLGEGDPLADFLGIDEEAVANSMEGIKDAFLEGFGSEGFAELEKFKSKSLELGKQLDRIKGSSGARKITNTFNKVFGENGIISKVRGFVDDVRNLINVDLTGIFDGFSLANFQAKLDGMFGAEGTLGTISLDSLSQTFTDTFGLSDGELWTTITDFTTDWAAAWQYPTGSIWTGLADLPTTLDTALVQPFRDKMSSIAAWFVGGGARDTAMSLKSTLATAVDNIGPWLEGLPQALMDNLVTPFDAQIDAVQTKLSEVFDPAEGTARQLLDSFITQVKAFFLDGAGAPFYDALSGIGAILLNLVLSPVEGMANAFLDGVTQLVNQLFEIIREALDQYNSLADKSLGILPHISTGGFDPISPPTIDITPELPEEARRGAWPGQGWLHLHRDELVYAPQPIGVFPQRLSRDLMRLMAGPAASPQYVPGGGSQTQYNSTTDNRQTTNHFTVRGQQSLRLVLAQARVW